MKRITFILMLVVASINTFSQTVTEGIKMIDAMKFDQAKTVFNNLLKSEPTNADLYYYLGDIYRRVDDANSAKLNFDKGLEISKENALCNVGLGQLLLDENKPEDAKTFFNKALEISKKKNAKVLLYIGEAYTQSEKNKDLVQAESLLTLAQTIEKNNPDIYIALGDLYLEKEDPSLPIKNYELALTKDPKYAKSYLKKGNLYSRARTPEAYLIAVETTKKGLEIDPDYAPLYAQMAEIYSLTRKYELAKENYVKYLSMVNNDLYARVRYASFLYLSKDYVKAIEEINNINQIDSSRPFLYRLLGCSYYETNNYAEGMINMDKFFAKQTNPSKIIYDDYRYYGLLLQKTGKDSLAIESFKKAMALDNSKSELYSEIGNNYKRNKKYNEAIAAFTYRLAIKDNITDNFALGQTYVFAAKTDSTRLDSALACFKKVTDMKADWPYGYYWTARTYTQKDIRKELKNAGPDALTNYQKFIDMTKADEAKYKKELIESYSYIGNLYHEKGMKTECIDMWKKVLELDPENKQANLFKKFYKF